VAAAGDAHPRHAPLAVGRRLRWQRRRPLCWLLVVCMVV
jgi:hypothetical protein